MGSKTYLDLSELRSLPAAAQEQRIREFATRSRGQLNGEVDRLNAEIAEFETRYERSSEAMRTAVSNGEMKETAEICTWLILLELRDRLSSGTPRP